MPNIEHEAGDLDTLTKRATAERDAAQRDRLRVAALAVPSVNTGTMNVFLGMLSTHRGPADHAVLIMD